ncbi:MAG: N-acetylmuramoyl-L-alanine amidase [Eubacteriales bacterium]|nr:N-acetylmuramoyl-L-alanine amidase [Eubacteriales bacterium]
MKSLHFRKLSPRFLTLFISLLFLALLTIADLSKTFDIFGTSSFCVVIDPGHGGEDPGKVSASGIREKDVNLAIALKCKSVLEQNGIAVSLTRETDCSLEEEGASNKKASDLKNRKRFILEQPSISCAVSIHQNSFPDSSQHGSQVFYQSGSEESKRLASLIQEQTRRLTGEENHREIKANSDYYLLRDNPVPTVIAEVCFLSNPSEADMITDENMQEKAAFSIAMGIMQYLYS